ncbi:hypothetical protein jhhlp_002055 [Lomentospora prolificans]|uniref:AMP-activated protein kinase glycogen-binding domain-containing protein n=1 Tax=Lomentospora prolificans TaxID=41688 RepID=A0A2N3NCX8_9PEZI|nr:hypothetical protein jhhlp_002055 [Lomentospora prolificans]
MTGKLPITLTYRKPGTQPPLFVAGTFTEPPWTAQEMSYTTGPDHEHSFSHTCKVEPGSEVQYKFRLGTGNWWVLKEGAPTVRDSAGNQNNVLKAPTEIEATKTPNSNHAITDDHQDHAPMAEQDPVPDGEYVNVNHGSTDNLIKNCPSGASANKVTTKQDDPVENSNARASAIGTSLRSGTVLKRRLGATSPLPTSDGLPPLKGDSKKGWIAKIIHTIFVDWIGGIFRQLFGRKQEPSN